MISIAKMGRGDVTNARVHFSLAGIEGFEKKFKYW